MSAEKTRCQIVEAADRLFYEAGFSATSFAGIAQAVGISRGNFYYHFKTKDEILNAVIALRLANTRGMLEAWQQGGATPIEAIRRFIHILIVNGGKIMAHGCPVGTLCNELAKLDHLSKDQAGAIFLLFRDWLAARFRDAGRGDAAEELALHLLMRSQGIAALAVALRDEEFVRREVEDMLSWLDAQVAPDAATGPVKQSSSG